MSTKHTPGPWNLHKYYTGEPLAVDGGDNAESFVSWTYCVAKGDLVLADISGYSNGRRSKMGFGRADKRSEVEANARRIVACVNACEGIADPSAVPELLEALEYTCNLLDRLPRLSDVDRIDAPGEAASVLKSARAAIAKATGNTL